MNMKRSIILFIAILSIATCGRIPKVNSYTLSDDKLSATFNSGAGASFGQLSMLSMQGGKNVIATTSSGSSVWSANFVDNTSTGKTSIASATAKCKATHAVNTTTTSFSLQWLDCVILGGHVNVTLDTKLSNGLLELTISFQSNGKVSLWDYTIAVDGIKSSAHTQSVSTDAAKQLKGLYDPSVSIGNAVYFAAHDPAQIVKTCAVAVGESGSLSCNILGTNATLPLYHYSDGFPIAVTVLTGNPDHHDPGHLNLNV